MKKKLLSLILAAVLVLGLIPCTVSAEDAGFQGTRTVIFTADSSYLENYFVGGRQMLDLTLRKSAPQWLSYQLTADGRDISLELTFDFSSIEDYTQKLCCLTTYLPAVYYEPGDPMTLVESYSAGELLNFIPAALPEMEYQPEKTLWEIFLLTHNRITVNGQEYIAPGDTIALQTEEAVVQADGLTIHTELSNDGRYRRTIEVLVNYDETRMAQFEAQFQEVGTVDKGENTVSVSFSTTDAAELATLTTRCLHTINSIRQSTFYVDDKTVGVTRTEIFFLDTLLTEDAQFLYTFTVPSDYRNLTVEETDGITLEGNTLTATNRDILVLNYQQGFRFTRIESHTDLSDLLGRIKQTVRFYAPTDIAAAYHETIKATFQARLCAGTTMNIYDEDGMRCYEFTFTGWYVSQVEEFNQAIFGSKDNIFRLQRGFFPFGNNKLEHTLKPYSALDNMATANQIIRTYTFPGGTNFLNTGTNADYVWGDNTVTIHTDGLVSVQFVSFNFFITLIYVVFLILLVVLVLMLLCVLRKKKKAKSPAELPETPADVPLSAPIETTATAAEDAPITEDAPIAEETADTEE